MGQSPQFPLHGYSPSRSAPVAIARGEKEKRREEASMSAMAVSSLNPDAPLFIPAAFRQVEDFSPQWWDLVKTTAWFRDHWFHEHQQLDEMADSLAFGFDDDDLSGLLPDDAFEDDDLFYDQPQENGGFVVIEPVQPHAAALKTDAVLKALSLASPKGGDAPRGFREKPRQPEKPTKYAGSPRSGGAPRVIHQPR
ncbi:hypothetical protein GUJ93_ZPchr0003g18425 [Zizania palustris]|uniref:Protein EARLY RESPONSIVE TO DEHYDRATION 15 n=1 Tax=Zizania palustris TaxID=103762 RepID=A0A8J5VYA0_ZIZPA|nr:hypothetical protein GUJ93_ZPchr0003g18425 [Zizania palustris]